MRLKGEIMKTEEDKQSGFPSFTEMMKGTFSPSTEEQMAALAKAAFEQAMKVIMHDRGTASDQIKEFMNLVKDEVPNLKAKEAYLAEFERVKVELRKVELEHEREMRRMSQDEVRDVREFSLEVIKMISEYEAERFKYHLNTQTGLLGLQTRSKKLTAALLARSDLTQFLQRFGLSKLTMALPAPTGSGSSDDGSDGSGKLKKVIALLEMLDEKK
jgi:hypothetical protein